MTELASCENCLGSEYQSVLDVSEPISYAGSSRFSPESQTAPSGRRVRSPSGRAPSEGGEWRSFTVTATEQAGDWVLAVGGDVGELAASALATHAGRPRRRN